MAAACRGHEDFLSLLIARRADVNAANCNGSSQYGTLLAAAALEGNMTAVKTLPENGANTDIVNGDYGTALAVASYSGYGDIMLKLLEHPGKISTP